MTQLSGSNGGATPGGKTLCSACLQTGLMDAAQAALSAGDPLRALRLVDQAYLVTTADPALLTVCSYCAQDLGRETVSDE